MAGEGFYDAGVAAADGHQPVLRLGLQLLSRREPAARRRSDGPQQSRFICWARPWPACAAAESDYRREFLPPPTRAKPFPDAAAVAEAQRLERLAHAISALEAALQHQPVPDNDRMTPALSPGGAHAAGADAARRAAGGPVRAAAIPGGALRTQPSFCKRLPDLEAGLEAIRETLRKRDSVLLNPA